MICFKFSKSTLTSCLQTRVSQNCAKKFKNWLRLCFGNVLKLKVTKGKLIISNQVEMADQYLMGGAPQAPPSRYRSAISTWFEIMSSPLVTFNFKTFPKHRRTQFLNFLAQIWETGVWRQEVSINFEKKKNKFDFFNFSWNKSYFFCLKLNSMWKMLSFEV